MKSGLSVGNISRQYI